MLHICSCPDFRAAFCSLLSNDRVLMRAECCMQSFIIQKNELRYDDEDLVDVRKIVPELNLAGDNRVKYWELEPIPSARKELDVKDLLKLNFD
jgi:hypothetical protein